MGKRLKDSEDAASYRAQMIKKQHGIDPITESKITDAVLDHQHFGEQKCRAVLQRTVNAWEGKVQNSFNRYVRNHTDLSLPDVLRNLADYLEGDYSANAIHHSALTEDVKVFKNLPAAEQKQLLIKLGAEPAENVKKRSSQIRKFIKSGHVTVIDKIWTIKKEP